MKQEIINDFKSFKTDLKNKNYKKQIANILTSIRLLSPFILIPLFYFNKLYSFYEFLQFNFFYIFF